MKLLIMLAFVLLLGGAVFSRDQARTTTTEGLIREMDSKLTAAVARGDSALVDALLAADYVETDGQGLLRYKPDVMTIVRAQASAPRSTSVGPEITVDETKVRVHGDTAIVFSVTTTQYQFMDYMALPQQTPAPSPNATDQYRLMKVYSKLKGRWQLIASQTTAIARH